MRSSLRRRGRFFLDRCSHKQDRISQCKGSMNLLALFVPVIASALLTGCASPLLVVQPPIPSRAEEVQSFKPVEPEQWSLSNGLGVIFLPDEELPTVRGQLFMKGGHLWAQGSPPGSVSAMGELMRRGGAGELGSDEVDRDLERLAATITTTFGAEFGVAGFSCLTSDFDSVFGLFAKVLLQPRFEGEKLNLWKGQAIEGIRRRKDDPGTVASTAFNQLLYAGSPYGRVSVESDITVISRRDIQYLHREFVRPNGAILVVTGNVSKEQVEQAVQESFGKWQPRAVELPPVPEVVLEPKPRVVFVELPFTQATIQAGHLGVARLTPDYPAIDVFNEVFGTSGFSSKLMNRVRTELGLSYGIYGGIFAGASKGMNMISAQTKAESVVLALEEALGVLRDVQTKAIEHGALSERKAAIRSSFVFNFDSSESVASRRARLQLLRYPSDYDQTYLTKIDSVTSEDLMQVAKERWDPRKFVVVIVGNGTAFEKITTAIAENRGPLAGFDLEKLSFDQALLME
jgi:zinc protease